MFEQLPDTSDGFYRTILSQSLTALKFNTYMDNFDEWRFSRFSPEGVDLSTIFDVNSVTNNFDWFFKQNRRLYMAYCALDSYESRRLYLHLIAFRMASRFCVKLPQPYLENPADVQAYALIENSVESEFTVSGLFGKLRHFDFDYKGHRYVADCIGGLEYYLLRGQYFYNQDGVTVRPESGDYVIDGGACTGDTALVFSNAVGGNGRVYAFDPIEDHLEIMRQNIKNFTHANVTAMPYGLSDHEVDVPPLVLNKYNPGFMAMNQQVPLRSIDSLVEEGQISRIDFLKLDVEGSEMEALRGSAHAISRFRPKMALSLYHKPNDIFEIIEYVRSNYPFYKLYLGHYTIHAEETVLYCAPEPLG